MTTIEYKLLREFRKLSQGSKREVLAYLKWVRDVEDRGLNMIVEKAIQKLLIRYVCGKDAEVRINASPNGIPYPISVSVDILFCL